MYLDTLAEQHIWFYTNMWLAKYGDMLNMAD